ncbi:MAG: hypothetical protein QNJ97_11065 [Myxococcota bacterium]|nr:hypothetical protein [Myxococcota bacterium]
MTKHVLFLSIALTGLMLSCFGRADTDDCRLSYPIVLSHHFGLRKICPNEWTAAQCMTREGDNVAKYCADWDDTKGCQQWVLPAEEAHLPPRVENLFDDNLKRTSDIAQYHRYFSQAIVDRLETCGNDVYIADKPAYASYQLRAASLRRTVMQALDQTGAEKVVIIGTSQGVQDARFMAAVLPADLNNPAAGTMKKHVAAVVSLAGEHRGAEIATMGISILYLSNYVFGDGWIDPVAGEDFWAFEGGEELATDLLWREVGNTTTGAELFYQPTVLTEGYDRNDPMEYDLTLDMKFRAFLHGLTVLSSQYIDRESHKDPVAWNDLREALGMEEHSWEDLVNEDIEACNGVGYYSYAARIRRWDYTYWGDATFYLSVTALYGPNDGYTTMDSQNFDQIGYDTCPDGHDNFQHIKTLDGSFLSNGYYHNYFTGRNKNYGPQHPFLQEPAPYRGNAADFYEQVMRDLIIRGY